MYSPEFTLITSSKPERLSKAFRLDPAGKLKKIPGGMLVEGVATRLRTEGVTGLAGLLQKISSNQAFVYGVSQHELANLVMDKALHLVGNNGGRPTIARTREHFTWPEHAAVLMLDYDPPDGCSPLSADAFQAAVYEICPAIKNAPHVVTASASSFIFHGQTMLQGPWGWRLLVIVANGRDIPRAGAAFFDRCWLNGKGHIAISKAGSFLERALVDAMVWTPERLDFIGGAHCFAPLEQKRPAPQVFNQDAPPLDTVAALKTLTFQETAKKRKLVEDVKRTMEPLAAKVREEWIQSRISEAVEQAPADERERVKAKLSETYRQAIKSQVLLADFVLQTEGEQVTVGEILDQPQKWHMKRFADPLEPQYQEDTRIAVANLFAAGQPYIFSHAHGGRRFTLHRARKTIRIIKGERIATIGKALELMRLAGQHFCRGGEIVKITSSGDVLPRERRRAEEMLYDLDCLARWERFDRGQKMFTPCDCDPNIASGVLAAKGTWALPELTSIATAPLMDPVTGRVIDRDGYDPGSQLMLILDEFEKWPGVPERPTGEQVRHAVSCLWRPFRDFPFVDDVARGVLLSAELTAAIRPLLPTAPAYALDAPTPGAGKTLAARCLAHLAGEKVPGMFPAAKEEDEIRKRLGALLRYNKRVVVLDNIETDLQSAAMCSLLTNEVFEDRILKASEILTVPTRVLFILTGNNLALRGDLCRRVLISRIDPKLEKPWERRFDLDPSEYCKDHRLEMVAAALTILKAGLLYGPQLPDRTASFEVWSDCVRRAVAYLKGIEGLETKFDDPIKSITATLESDSSTGKLDALLGAWVAEFGTDQVTVSKIIKTAKEKISKESDEYVYPDLRAAVEEIAADKGGLNPRRFGWWLEKNRGRIIGGRRLEKAEEKGHGGGRQWKVGVVEVGKKGPAPEREVPANVPQEDPDLENIPGEGLPI